MVWTANKTLAVILAAFLGLWAAAMLGLPNWVALLAGIGFAIAVWAAIRRR